MKKLGLFLSCLLLPIASEAQPSLRLAGVMMGTNQRVILTLKDGQIQCLDQDRPSTRRLAQNCLPEYRAVENEPVVETDGLISAGFFDLHNHIEFNSLPLWKEAKGQFKNRFEWREFPSYADGPHKFYMRKMKEDPEFACLSLRWSEIKALTGGVTAIQGLGRRENEACAASFGIRNLEIERTMGFGDRSVSGSFEVLTPEVVKSYKENLEARVDQGEGYDLALAAWTLELGIQEWLNIFLKEDPQLKTGLRLTLGPLVEDQLQSWEDKNGQLDLNSVGPFLNQALLSSPLKAALGIKTLADRDRLKLRVLAWLDGDHIDGWGYLDLTDPKIDRSSLALRFLAPSRYSAKERQADAVSYIPRSAREYLVDFELGVLRRVRTRLEDPQVLSFFTHLAEGRREDPYSAQEFKYARDFGLLQPKFVAIHGTGFSSDQLREAARKGLPVVWSPSSNLLLYGETLNISEALAAGVLVGLGSDWSITGTKTILDEARVAAVYAEREGHKLYSADLHRMLTVNAAKIAANEAAYGYGEVKLGARADLTVLRRSLLASQQEDVILTVVDGQPLFGDTEVLSRAAVALGDTQAVEVIPTDCLKPSKAFRLVNWDKLSERIFFTDIRDSLIRKFADAQKAFDITDGDNEALQLDPIFSCEDATYKSRLLELVN